MWPHQDVTFLHNDSDFKDTFIPLGDILGDHTEDMLLEASG